MRQVRLGRNAFLMVSVLLVANVEAGVALDAEITFFSESSGLLVDGGGNPQAGIRVVRSWKRTPEHEPMIDETVTSPSGAFSFPAATGTRPMAGRLPGTPVIRQEITAFGPGGPVTLGRAVKTNLDPNGELEGRPLNLECRIDVEPNGDGPVWGTCREVSGQFAAAAKAGGGALELTCSGLRSGRSRQGSSYEWRRCGRLDEGSWESGTRRPWLDRCPIRAMSWGP